MKRSVLTLFVGIGLFSFGQNVTENKVSFNFIQLPTNPIAKEYSTFTVLVERKYEQANQDSLNAYQLKLDAATNQYQAELAAWKQQKIAIQRDYLQKMAAWQKSSNAGTLTPQPVVPVYPVQPVMADVEYPKMHSDITDGEVQNAVSLAGYSRADGGAYITVGILPLSDLAVNMKTSGEGASLKYNYSANYKLPLELKVETPSQGVILQTIILNNVSSYNMNSYASQYEFDLWWLDNKDQFWLDLEKYARSNAFKVLNETVNDKCGFPVKSSTIEVFTIKKHKKHTYDDLTNAYTIASQGYQMIAQSKDRSKAKGKLNEAITIWKKALTESNVNDNDARINDKGTAMLQCNIAMAYIWLSEFDNAEMFINQALNSTVGKFKRVAEDYRGYLNERKIRWNTNF
ncbi:MAG: hypothetical protein R2780_03855 [Crocinitomicaceae bacterium]